MALSGLTSWEDATTSRESAFTMRGVDRSGMSGVERGGVHSTIVWGDEWNDKKKRGNGALALSGPNFMGRSNNQPRVGVHDEGY
jgi:hypothetical protein